MCSHTSELICVCTCACIHVTRIDVGICRCTCVNTCTVHVLACTRADVCPQYTAAYSLGSLLSPGPRALTHAGARAGPCCALGWDTEASPGSHADLYATLAGPAFKVTSEILNMRLLSGWCEEGAESPGSFLSCHRFSYSVPSPRVQSWAGVGYRPALKRPLSSTRLQVRLSPGLPEPAGWPVPSSWAWPLSPPHTQAVRAAWFQSAQGQASQPNRVPFMSPQ